MHSEKFDRVYTYYKNKLWDEDRVRNAVLKGWITIAEYSEITGMQF